MSIIILVVIFSCTNKTVNNINTTIIDVTKTPDGVISYDSVTMIPIESATDKLLSENIKIRFTDSNIYIADAIHKCIFKYDNQGRFIIRIGTNGKGPNEYLYLTDFIVKNDTVEIMSAVGDKTRVLRFDSNGKFINQNNFKFIASAFEKVGADYVFSTSYNKHFHKYRLYVLDKSGEILHKYLKNNTSLKLPVEEEKFSRSGSHLFYKESFDNNVYSIESEGTIIRYSLDFGDFSIPKTFFVNDFYKEFEKLNKQGFLNINKFFENNRYAFFEVVFPKENQSSEINQLLYEKSTKRIYKQEFTDDNISCFSNVIGLTENDELIYLQNALDIIQKRDDLEKENIVNKQVINEIEEDDNSVLFICKIK